MNKLLLTGLSCLALGTIAAPANAAVSVISMTITGTDWSVYFGTPAGAPVDPVVLDFTLTSDDGGTFDPTDAGLVINSFNLPYPLLYSSDADSLVIATSPFAGGGGCNHIAGSFCAFISDPFGTPVLTFMEQSPVGGGGWVAGKTSVGPSGPVPEPASWAMMIGGLALVGSAMRRRKVAVSFG